jgi:enterochelin esterase family protein
MRRRRARTALAVLLAAFPLSDARGQSGGPRPDAPPESPRLAALSRTVREGGPDALDRFWAEVKGKLPLVEPAPADGGARLVTFLWRGGPQTRRVDLVGGMPLGRPKPLSRLGDTDLWYWTERVPKDARFGYGFVENAAPGARARLRPDPLGARTYAEQSVAELPDAPPQPWSEPREGVPRGKLEAHRVPSAALGADRRVTVYTPPGYDPRGGENGLLVVFDGESCGGDLEGFNPIPGPVILDNLIARGKIRPAVALFVESGETRDCDLGCHPPFAEFVAGELVPWARSRYRVSPDPGRAVVCGFSRGGLGAAYCALRHPEVFGNVLALSGAFWWYPEADRDARVPPAARPLLDLTREPGWLTRQFADGPRVPVRFYLEAGRFEERIREESWRLRDVLRAKGCDVAYREHNGGHDYAAWRGSFADGLLALAGK